MSADIVQEQTNGAISLAYVFCLEFQLRKIIDRQRPDSFYGNSPRVPIWASLGEPRNSAKLGDYLDKFCTYYRVTSGLESSVPYDRPIDWQSKRDHHYDDDDDGHVVKQFEIRGRCGGAHYSLLTPLLLAIDH